MTSYNGLKSVLRPEASVLVQADHQPYRPANLNSQAPQAMANVTTELVKVANAFRVLAILTSAVFELKEVVRQHVAGFGMAFLREHLVLNTPFPNTQH